MQFCAVAFHARGRWTAGALTLAALLAATAPAQAQAPFVHKGEAGFVVTDIRYALGDDAEKTGACPNGMSLDVEQIFARSPQGKRRRGETDAAYAERLQAGAQAVSTAPTGENLCMSPQLAGPDPYFRTVSAPGIPADGIDLDGVDSRSGDAPPPGACPHDDLPGLQGAHGVDNQFFRAVGCSRSFQSNGQSNGFAIEMLTGAWGILLTLSGVDDIRNDDDVEVGLYANADPIQLSPNRVPLEYATYAMDQDPRFRAKTRGRIKDGVLTTDPVDVRFRHVTNSLRLERVLRAARLQMTLSGDGALQGYLAGYAPVEAMYDQQFGFRNGKDGAGKPGNPRLILGTANGAARVLGYSCPGIYHALQQYADGDRDPASGQCTSISTQYRLKAIPAFVVDVATQSINSKLKDKADPDAER
jgi:hypothetical protein